MSSAFPAARGAWPSPRPNSPASSSAPLGNDIECESLSLTGSSELNGSITVTSGRLEIAGGTTTAGYSVGLTTSTFSYKSSLGSAPDLHVSGGAALSVMSMKSEGTLENEGTVNITGTYEMTRPAAVINNWGTLNLGAGTSGQIKIVSGASAALGQNIISNYGTIWVDPGVTPASFVSHSYLYNSSSGVLHLVRGSLEFDTQSDDNGYQMVNAGTVYQYDSIIATTVGARKILSTSGGTWSALDRNAVVFGNFIVDGSNVYIELDCILQSEVVFLTGGSNIYTKANYDTNTYGLFQATGVSIENTGGNCTLHTTFSGTWDLLDEFLVVDASLDGDFADYTYSGSGATHSHTTGAGGIIVE